MKHLLSLAVGICLALIVNAQVPDKMNYQGVARDAGGSPISGQIISLRASILQGSMQGPVVLEETHTPTTNEFGLFNILIGNGEPTIQLPIQWANYDHFLKIEMDPTGGTDFQLTGTSQLISVPYAFHAATVEETRQTFETFYGSGTPQFWTSTDVTYTGIDGLDAIQIDVPENMFVLFLCSGEASIGNEWNAWAQLQVALFLDDVQPAAGAMQRIQIVSDDDISSGGSVWSFSHLADLTAGTHTVSIKARAVGEQNQATIGISSNVFYSSLPTVQIIYLRK